MRAGHPLLVVALAAALLLTSLDAYVVASVLPAFVTDFSVPIDHLERLTPIISGFLIGYVAAIPVVAGLATGRRLVGIAAGCLALFAAGSLVTANSQDLGHLVAGRVIQGASGGALIPLTFAAAADIADPRRRLLAIGSVAAVQEFGALLGPVYGALLSRVDAQNLAWRLIFWVNVPAAALCSLALLLALYLAGRRQTGQPAVEQSPDLLGGLLLGICVSALVIALYPEEPARSPFNQPLVVLPALLTALVSGWLFAWRAGTTRPLLSRQLIRSPAFAGATGTTVLVGGALVAAVVEIPLLARTVFGLDELGAAGLLARLLVGVPLGALAGGWIAGRSGPRPLVLAGLAISAAGFALMSTWHADELVGQGSSARAGVVLVATGLGFGLVIGPLTSIILAVAERTEHAGGAAVAVLARTVGMVLGLAVLSGVGLHHFYDLVNSGPQLNPVLGAPDFLEQARALRDRYNMALLAEYQQVFAISAAVCVVAAAMALATLRPHAERL